MSPDTMQVRLHLRLVRVLAVVVYTIDQLVISSLHPIMVALSPLRVGLPPVPVSDGR